MLPNPNRVERDMPCGYRRSPANGQLDAIIFGRMHMTHRAHVLAASVDAIADGHNRITFESLRSQCGLHGRSLERRG